jgi:hypothetical protein
MRVFLWNLKRRLVLFFVRSEIVHFRRLAMVEGVDLESVSDDTLLNGVAFLLVKLSTENPGGAAEVVRMVEAKMGAAAGNFLWAAMMDADSLFQVVGPGASDERRIGTL